MPPEPSWTALYRGPGSLTASNQHLEAAVCKGTGKSPRAAHTSPNGPKLRKAVQDVFTPRPCAPIGRCGAGLPLDPWALLLCWGSPEPETHSPRVLLRGECRIGCAKGFCAQASAMPPEPAQPHSAEAPSQRRPKKSFWELDSAKGNSPCAANHSLSVPRRRKSTQAVFAPGLRSP